MNSLEGGGQDEFLKRNVSAQVDGKSRHSLQFFCASTSSA